jgi:hypothetical protein
VAAQGATTPLLVVAPEEPLLLPEPPPVEPLQTVCGSSDGDGTGVQGNPGGMLTGEGTGMVTLGPALPPR